MNISNTVAKGYGALPADWDHFANGLQLTEDLLPVVSNPKAVISKRSGMTEKGKTPSRYYRGEVGGIPKWPTKKTTPVEIALWKQDTDLGICLQTRRVKAIDIDIADPVVTAEVQSMIELTLGKLPCRGRSNSGKVTVYLRCDAEFPKRIIDLGPAPVRVDKNGKPETRKIELLSNGQQSVVCGTHPSGVRYEWDGGLPAEIPTISLAELDEVWAGLAAMFAVPGGVSTGKAPIAPQRPRNASDARDPFVPKLFDIGWVLQEDADGKLHGPCPNGGQHTPGVGGITSSTYLPIGIGGETQPGFKCLHAHCSHINGWSFLRLVGVDDPADDFEVVVLTPEQAAASAAAAIHNAKLPARVKLESEADRAARLERERSMRIGADGEQVSIPTQRVMTGSEMLEELVFITEGSRVSYLKEPRNVLPFDAFKKATAGSIASATNAAGRKTNAKCADLWLASPDRKTVRTQTFAPGRPVVCESPDGAVAQNLWLPRSPLPPPPSWRELSAFFFEHVAYLVPVVAERERFLDWLAHIEQDPGTLPSTHYLMVAHQTGIGRNWMAYALARAFARYTALGYDLGQALRNGFNGQLSQRLLVVVDELHEGGPGAARSASAEKLKSMVTEATRLVNPKGLQQHIEFNCARFLMFSNHASALPLADNDRRVIVIENPSSRRSEADYRKLYSLLDNPDFGPALAHALGQRDISGFNPGAVAPASAAKERTIRAGRTEIEQAVRDIAAEWPSACITSSALTYAVQEALGGKQWNVQAAAVAAGLVKYQGRVRVAGVPSHIWVLRDASVWMQAEGTAVRDEVERGRRAASIAEFA